MRLLHSIPGARRRAKITGIGPVTPAGVGREDFHRAIREGKSYIKAYTEFGAPTPYVTAKVEGFEVGRYADRTLLPTRGCARHAHLAVAATHLALKDAEIALPELRGVRCAVVVGTSIGSIGYVMELVEDHTSNWKPAHSIRAVSAVSSANIPDAINRTLGIASLSMTNQNSCCAGADAVGTGMGLIERGEADIVICGGTESGHYQLALQTFQDMLLSPSNAPDAARICRPFDLWRTTGVVSEGACMVVLEPETSPREGYCLVSGYGFGNDEAEVPCSGLTGATDMALAQAHLGREDVEVIHAWGPGHRMVDEAEAQVMRRIFNGQLPGIPATSIKGAVGSPLGAAPAIMLAAAALGLKHGEIPPTVNWEYPDPACPLCLSGRLRSIPHRVALLNAHGMGNVNASLVLEGC